MQAGEGVYGVSRSGKPLRGSLRHLTESVDTFRILVQSRAMWTYAQARRVIDVYIRESSEDRCVVVGDRTIDKPYGWVFRYDSRAFLETGDRNQRIPGCAPLIFDRFSGEIRVTGTARDLEGYLADYEASLPPACLSPEPESSSG